MAVSYPKVAQLKTVERFKTRCDELQISIPVSDEAAIISGENPLARFLKFGALTVGNRWCIHPMEGWDANPDGTASALTLRRWQRFGQSGAKLIWGGEAAAVRPDGRANPRQTMASEKHIQSLSSLRYALTQSHLEAMGTCDDLVVGLQLTHSGRFSRPNSKKLEPRIAYHHPLLDQKFNIDPEDETLVWTDDQLDDLIGDYVNAAKAAHEAGFQFVDIKACHGYLLHEFLSARCRPGSYGGDMEGRSRLLCSIISAIRSELPTLEVGVRLSLFDRPPYEVGQPVGQPMKHDQLLPYQFGFGSDPSNPLRVDLTEPFWLLNRLQSLGVAAINLTCGSPYYNPHIQRPAIFPPSDGYLPPEDPLIGVARQIEYATICKQRFPKMIFVGSGYTYLQDFLPAVAHAVVQSEMIDSVGLGRMVLSYPEMPRDNLQGSPPSRKLVCRTFSDCTTAPRHGLVSGCFPLDPFYKELPEAVFIKNL